MTNLGMKCSHCGHQFEAVIADLKSSDAIVCPACGGGTLEYDAKTLSAISKETQEAFDKTIKRVTRRSKNLKSK